VKVYTDIASVPKAERGISIGVFDGVHRGHQALLRQLLAESHRHSWRALVLTFTNHPQEILNPPPPPLLTTVEERVQRLSELGMDEVLVLPFTEALSRYSAERFCREVLVEALGCRLLVAGEDFALGHRREGTISRLRELGRQLGFQVVVAPTVCHEGQPISSSHIRQLLLNGQIERANELLSAPFRLTGTVVAGAGRGKALGFPTINLQIPSGKLLPHHGIYAGKAHLPEGVWDAAVYIGVRPSFNEATPVVEAHLLDFEGTISYGTSVTVELLAFVREDRRFESIDALIEQMRADVTTVRERLRG
jgi:riboflavin kinase/FMN adenylyltransferase